MRFGALKQAKSWPLLTIIQVVSYIVRLKEEFEPFKFSKSVYFAEVRLLAFLYKQGAR